MQRTKNRIVESNLPQAGGYSEKLDGRETAGCQNMIFVMLESISRRPHGYKVPLAGIVVHFQLYRGNAEQLRRGKGMLSLQSALPHLCVSAIEFKLTHCLGRLWSGTID